MILLRNKYTKNICIFARRGIIPGIMKIAVYGGSFNPLHLGHKAIMEYLTLEAGYDWVYLVVTPQNPLKEKAAYSKSGEERYAAAVEAVCRHPEVHVWVDNIELEMDPPQYTIRTLDALKVREPENDFTLVMGADNLCGLDRWKDYRRILTEYGVAVFPRRGYHRGYARARLLRECPGARIRLLDAPLVTISSTEIREGLAAGKDMSHWLM